MKSEYSQLSYEAHECVDSIPELNQMVFAVQELGMFELHYLVYISLIKSYFVLAHNSSCFECMIQIIIMGETIFLQLSNVKISK